MKISYKGPILSGYTPIVERRGETADLLMDFGIVKLSGEQTYFDLSEHDERCFIICTGSATIFIDKQKYEWKRSDYFDDAPFCVSIPRNMEIKIVADKIGTEIFRIATVNEKEFPFRHFSSQECRNELRGSGTMQETSTRIVRTIFDTTDHNYSNLVIGEVVNSPGKWSSYPPHHHPQPEIYHYRFKPSHGFGFTCIGDRAYKTADKDTILIRDKEDHPQVSAPGYAMWYLWVIRHIPGNPYIKPEFTLEHTWVTNSKAPIWEPKAK